MQGHFEIQLVEMYFGVPILEARCREPTLLVPETDVEMANALLEQAYPRFAVVLNFRNLSHGASYGPEEEAEVHRNEPFVALSKRLVAVVRYDAASLSSLVHAMRVNMMLRHSRATNFAPDFESAVRIARRAIDRSNVLTP